MFNVPQKLAKTVQVWVCLLLTVIALVMSFMPIIKLDTSKNAAAINEMIDSMDLGVDMKVPEEVDVSAVGLVKSGILVFDIISLATDDTPSEAKLEAFEAFCAAIPLVLAKRLE